MQNMHRFAHDAPINTTDGVAEMVAYLASIMPKLEPPATAAEWHARAAATRTAMLELLMSGHPTGVLDDAPRVEWTETLEVGEGYRIRKLRYEGYPGLWAPALLYEPTTAGDGPLPAVLNAEGHHPAGNALPMKQQRCINLARRGIINLSYEFLGMGELGVANGHPKVEQLNACGVYGVGVFYLIMKRALDILLGLPRVDRSRVADDPALQPGYAHHRRHPGGRALARLAAHLHPRGHRRPGADATRLLHGGGLRRIDGDDGTAAVPAHLQPLRRLLLPIRAHHHLRV
jgi:hypothetical protein